MPSLILFLSAERTWNYRHWEGISTLLETEQKREQKNSYMFLQGIVIILVVQMFHTASLLYTPIFSFDNEAVIYDLSGRASLGIEIKLLKLKKKYFF